MTRLTWPMVSLFVLLFVVALPTRARPQIVYDLSQINRSMQMYVYDSNGNPLAEDSFFNSTPGVFTEIGTLAGNNGPDPWEVRSVHDSDLELLSITGSGAIDYSTHNEDKSQIGLTSNLYSEFTVDVLVPYTFTSIVTGGGYASLDDLSLGMPMPGVGFLEPGHVYLLFAEAVTFQFNPPADSENHSSWFVNLQIVPSPAAWSLAFGCGAWFGRRRR